MTAYSVAQLKAYREAEPAAARLTVGHVRAVQAVIDRRTDYPTLDDLAAACALAALTAEDDKTRSVVAVLEDGQLWVFGPYATHGAASTALEAGLATKDGARGGVFPLVTAPKAAARKKAA